MALLDSHYIELFELVDKAFEDVVSRHNIYHHFCAKEWGFGARFGHGVVVILDWVWDSVVFA